MLSLLIAFQVFISQSLSQNTKIMFAVPYNAFSEVRRHFRIAMPALAGPGASIWWE